MRKKRKERRDIALEDKGLPLDRNRPGLAHRLIYKGKGGGGNPVFG